MGGNWGEIEINWEKWRGMRKNGGKMKGKLGKIGGNWENMGKS